MKRNHNLVVTVLKACILLGFSDIGFAEENDLRCDKDQTYCLVKSKRLVIGDNVGIFSQDEELVAYGTVKEMEGRNRRIEIIKANGKITKTHHLARLDDNKIGDIENHYKIPKQPVSRSLGGDFGIAAIGEGEGLAGFSFEGYYQQKFLGDLSWVGRGIYMRGSGKSTAFQDELVESNLTVNAIGGTGGVGYTLLPQKTVSFRTEAGLGFMYVNAGIDQAGSAREYMEKLSPGFGLTARGQTSAVMNFKDWKPSLNASVLLVQEAMTTVIGLGLSKALP